MPSRVVNPVCISIESLHRESLIIDRGMEAHFKAVMIFVTGAHFTSDKVKKRLPHSFPRVSQRFHPLDRKISFLSTFILEML